MVKYQGFIWAGILVEEMEKSVAFYQDILGLPFLRKGEDWAHFDAGNGTLLELLGGGKAAHEPKRPDQQPITLGFHVENLDSAVAELKEKGVSFLGDIGEYKNHRWAHFSDPEGNRLEIKEVRAER